MILLQKLSQAYYNANQNFENYWIIDWMYSKSNEMKQLKSVLQWMCCNDWYKENCSIVLFVLFYISYLTKHAKKKINKNNPKNKNKNRCLFHNPFVSVKHFVPGLRHLLSVLDYIPGGSTVLTLWISLRGSLCRHTIQFNSLLTLLQGLFGCLFIWGMYDIKDFLKRYLKPMYCRLLPFLVKITDILFD